MKFTVKTESGSVYEFTHQDTRTFFRHGDLFGEVVSIENGTITTGQALSFKYHTFNMHDHSPTLMTTDVVKEISIILL